MAKYIEGRDRNQLNMSPMALDEMITENNPVRVIDALVETFDMLAMGFKHAKPSEIGRYPYNPKSLMKLYIYGYFNGIRSTRKLEKECRRNIEAMWLLEGLTPDDKTISNFRKENKEAMKEVFKEFHILCNELQLFGKKLLAVDGSKFKANNARRKSFTKKKVKKMLEHYEKKVEEYMELLTANDKESEQEEKIKYTNKEIISKIEEMKKRVEELTEMGEKIEESGEISLTDPDSRHMSVSNNGTDIAHNVQIAVDSKAHLVVAVDVVSTPADQKQLHNIAKKAVEELWTKEEIERMKEDEENIITVLADKGYYSGEELKKCKEDHIETIVPKQRGGANTGNNEFAKEKFEYDKEQDIYICPRGKVLKNISRESSKEQTFKNFEACAECDDKSKCTTAEKGRKVTRGEYQEIYDEVNERTKENKVLYKQRQMLGEHPFGTVKRALGFSYFLTRGNASVKAESYMHFFTYNLIRVINVVGVEELTRRLKARKRTFFAIFYRCLIYAKTLVKNQRLCV